MKRTVRSLALAVLVLSLSILSLSTASSAQIGIGISVRIAPPALPVYAQPICPGPGYLWTPGYWAWSDDDGYYWVPGTWVVAPVGMLWTPGYWGWGGGFYRWHAGYWGPHVGFYGGINYGFGYTGVGFFGGEWRGGSFFYNRSVVNVNVRNVTNVYNRTVIVNNRRNVSFNGPGGIEARPTREQERYSREPHREALGEQREHEHAASQNRQLFARENHGRPEIAATARPGDFHGNFVRARAAGGSYHEPRISPRVARVQPEGNRDFNNNGNRRDNRSERQASRPAFNEARNNQHENQRNNPGNNPNNNRREGRAQMSSRENSGVNRAERGAQRQERQPQRQERQAQRQERQPQKQNQSQPRAEHKPNGREPRR